MFWRIFFYLPGYDTLGRLNRGVIIPGITWQILNQNRKYFYPLVSGPGRSELLKKNEGRKSRWTVP